MSDLSSLIEDLLTFQSQKVASQQLRKAGCIVHVANHGLECLNFLETTIFCAAATPLSIILLDVSNTYHTLYTLTHDGQLEMPTMDGLTCIRQIRERQEKGTINKHVPVIAVTANARPEQVSAAFDAGMDQVVTKPFRIPELMPQMHDLVAELAQLQESD